MHSRRRIRRALRPVEGTREHIVNSLVNVILLMKSIALRNPLWRKTMAECTPCKMYSCECQYWVPCRKFKEFKRTVEMKRIGHVFKHTTPVTPARYKLDPRSSSHCGKCGHAMDAHRAFETHRPVSYFLKLRVDLDIIELFRRKDDKTMEEQFFESVAQLMRKAMSSSVFLGECVKADTNPYFSIPLTALQGTSILNAVISYVFKYTRVQTTMAKRQLFQMASVVVSIVNRTVFDSPTERAEKTGGHDMLYEEMYKRWFLYCHLPNICRTLPHYFPVNIFNVQFLLDVRDQIYDRLQQFGCNRIPADIQLRDDLLTFFQEMMGAMHGGDLDVIRGHVAPENVQDQKDLVELRRATGKHMKPIVEEEIRFVQK